MPNQENYDPGLKYGNTIIADDIASNAVTTAKINSAAVTGSKLSTALGYFSVMQEIDGTTTEQTLFGVGGLGVASTITGIMCSVKDGATAITVSLVNGTASSGTVTLSGYGGGSITAGSDAVLTSVAVSASTNVFIQSNNDGVGLAVVNFEIG